MTSLNIAILGEDTVARESAASALGKKSSVDDIGFYHSLFQGKIVTAIDCAAYPAKLPCMLQAIELGDLALVLADKPSPALGEIIVALDVLGRQGVFVTSVDLTPLLSQTSLKESKVFYSLAEAKEYLLGIDAAEAEGSAKVLLDHCFEVKGVGTVALGVVKRGEVKVHDKLLSHPQGLEVEVKSIQKNDEDVQAASACDRVGLSLKNCRAEDLPRGTVLANELVQEGKEIACSISVSKFSKEPVVGGAVLHLAAGLQFEPVKVECEGGIKPGETKAGRVVGQKPIAFEKGEKMVLADLNAKGLRVIANATVP